MGLASFAQREDYGQKFYGYSAERLSKIKLQDLNAPLSREAELENPKIKDLTEDVKSGKRAENLQKVLLATILLLIIAGLYSLRNIKKLELKNAEINSLNELTFTFIDASHDIVFLKDEKFKYILVNKGYEEFIKMDSSQVIGRSDFDLIDKRLANQYRKIDLEVVSKKTTIESEFRIGDRIQKTTQFPVKLVNGNYGVGAYIEDVTESYKNKEELKETNSMLELERQKLKLILDSTAEGIYGMNVEGHCTFFNNSGLEILAYKSSDQLIGKNLHWEIHHSHREGSIIPLGDCKIFKSMSTGESVTVNDEVFWRADGTCFDVEYSVNPQFQNGEIVGVVVTFSDITNRKRAEKEIAYFSYHDSLTGVYNRRFFEENFRRLDVERNLPISIILGDVNGLKLTNDIFGHATGDLLLKKSAEVLKSACRADDILARLGGDEFAILLPKTSTDEAKKIVERIKGLLLKENVKDIKMSISLGCDTKHSKHQDIHEILENAEEKMYLEKTIYRKNINMEMINSIMETIYEKNPREKLHIINVSELCEKMGHELGLNRTEVRILKEAAYYHDIGKIIIERNVIDKRDRLDLDEWQELKQHPLVGYRILNSCSQTSNLAVYVLHHHERWDGSGYPQGLMGELIPQFSRIIALADSYDRMIRASSNGKTMTKKEAILEIQKNAGLQFDPELAEVFTSLIKKEGIQK